jgi:hypothetical protein
MMDYSIRQWQSLLDSIKAETLSLKSINCWRIAIYDFDLAGSHVEHWADSYDKYSCENGMNYSGVVDASQIILGVR